MTTKYKIAEQVLQLLKGSMKAADSPEIEDVIEAVGQYINAHFKQEHLSVNMPSGETIPEGVMLASYDGLTPVQYKNVSKITLPITPISLPRNMGVFHVSRATDLNDGFIPLQTSQLSLIKGERLISGLLGQVGYEVIGNDVVFNKDLTTEDGISIYVRLAVFDISQYDDYSPLPLPADMESTIIQECVKLFSVQPPASQIVDSSAERQNMKQ